jgi:hypothetical protein
MTALMPGGLLGAEASGDLLPDFRRARPVWSAPGVSRAGQEPEHADIAVAQDSGRSRAGGCVSAAAAWPGPWPVACRTASGRHRLEVAGRWVSCGRQHPLEV